MTIAEEITALRQRISEAYDVIDQKGGDVPFDRTSWNLSASIDSIRTGGGGEDPAAIVPVQYLKSTGTQYIDTEAFITNTWQNRLEIYIDYQFDGVPTENERMWGALSSTSAGPYYQAFQNQAATPFHGFQCGGGNIFSMTTGFGDRYKVNVRRTGQNPSSSSAYSAEVNGSLSNIAQAEYGTLTYSPYLFARNLTGEAQNFAKGKLFRYVHKQRGQTIRDMMPVRVGDVGYMYDIPTGRLFGNKGTGAFSFGLDKIPILSDAVEIEYIEFSGTQYIDTGIMPTSTTGAQLDFTLTDANNVRGLFGETGPGLFAGGGSFALYPETPSNNVIPTYVVAYGGYTSETISLPLNTRATHHLNYMNSGTAGVQGYMTKTLGTSGALQGYNLWIGALNCGGWRDARFVGAGRLYSCKITNGTTLVRDFVPVKIGTTGYLYDRVSQTLFGNIGTGDFMLGPDIG